VLQLRPAKQLVLLQLLLRLLFLQTNLQALQLVLRCFSIPMCTGRGMCLAVIRLLVCGVAFSML
jgi:hypothetical protein